MGGRRANAYADAARVIEGAASYGGILTGTEATHGFLASAETPRADAKKYREIGKSDVLDSHRKAMAVLPLPVEIPSRPRLNKGIHQCLRIPATARGSMSKDRTRTVNALNVLVRGNDLGIDARRKLAPVQILEVSRWREREEELALGIARAAAVCIAKHIVGLDGQVKSNEQKLDERVRAS